MNHLEEQLKRALSREAPPHGFAERVLSRIRAKQAREPERRQSLRIRRSVRKAGWATATVAAVLTLASGVWLYRSYERERAEGERAKEQVKLAFQIASAKLIVVRKKVQENSRRGEIPEPRDEGEKE